MLMRELNRLLDERVRGSHEIGPLQHRNRPPQSQDDEQNAD
jgi:hypothetical protein